MIGFDTEVSLFLKTRGQVCKRSSVQFHAYVLMSIRYHVLLETLSSKLVEGVKGLQGAAPFRLCVQAEDDAACRRKSPSQDSIQRG